jgi:hypothetical protein
VIEIGSREGRGALAAPRAGRRRWRLTNRAVSRGVKPLWERADGLPISEDPAYRGREFTEDGRLVGKAVDVIYAADLHVDAPSDVTGLRVRLELADLAATAHEYTTSWGWVKVVDAEPVEIGRLPDQEIAVRAGRTRGPARARKAHERSWAVKPDRSDVVRVAGYGFGLRCGLRIEIEGFGDGVASGDSGAAAACEAAPALRARREPAASVAARLRPAAMQR